MRSIRDVLEQNNGTLTVQLDEYVVSLPSPGESVPERVLLCIRPESLMLQAEARYSQRFRDSTERHHHAPSLPRQPDALLGAGWPARVDC